MPAAVLRQRSDAWFPFAAHLIRGLYGTARTIEATARQRESLVTLGTLAAGLAHEINNPAAAAARAVDTLEDACRHAARRRSAGSPRAEISTAQFAALDALRHRDPAAAARLSPLAMADLEDELTRGWPTTASTVTG